MTTPTDKGTGAFLCENRHAMVHYWASECPACWNHARGRREALEEAIEDFERLHREGREVAEEGVERARPKEEIEADALRAACWKDAAEELSALARKESRKEK
jgi:hypothetical protein